MGEKYEGNGTERSARRERWESRAQEMYRSLRLPPYPHAQARLGIDVHCLLPMQLSLSQIPRPVMLPAEIT